MALNDLGVDVSMEKYEELGLFKRLGKMFSGFSKPHDTREYKEALIELQRLSAPITAILLPLISVVVLIVVSAVSGKKTEQIQEVGS